MRSRKFWFYTDYVTNEYLDRVLHFNFYLAPVLSFEIELWWFRIGAGIDFRRLYK